MPRSLIYHSDDYEGPRIRTNVKVRIRRFYYLGRIISNMAMDKERRGLYTPVFTLCSLQSRSFEVVTSKYGYSFPPVQIRYFHKEALSKIETSAPKGPYPPVRVSYSRTKSWCLKIVQSDRDIPNRRLILNASLKKFF